MEKEIIASTLKKLKENSPKRNFKQSIDLVINLSGLDLKKPEHQINMFGTLHYSNGRKISVCALVDRDMEAKAKEACNEVVLSEQFERFKKPSEIKKLASKHTFFIAQASIMPKIATIFGRFLGPRGKMPNPKVGGILPPNANIKQLIEKLANTVALATKNEPTIKCRVGSEDMEEEKIIDNVMTVYNTVLPKLPNEKQNVKSVMLKLTMGPAFVIGEKTEEKSDDKKGKAKKAKKLPAKENAPAEQKEQAKPAEQAVSEKKPKSKPSKDKK
jgi:large subunit ribosomal protein L1